jgi:hypothetical protein
MQSYVATKMLEVDGCSPEATWLPQKHQDATLPFGF